MSVKSVEKPIWKSGLSEPANSSCRAPEGTYRITRSTTVEQLCTMMTAQFRKEWRELQSTAHARPVNEIVTLASLVEKETGRPEDRPIVASVYQNRLRKGMALDCDPTTIYAALLDARYRGTIYRSDLASDNAYNTYRHAGLPPGPIANPGVASLKAALAPAETDYLLFRRQAGWFRRPSILRRP